MIVAKYARTVKSGVATAIFAFCFVEFPCQYKRKVAAGRREGCHFTNTIDCLFALNVVVP